MDISQALGKVLDDVVTERERQDSLKASGKFKYIAADPQMSNAERTLILGEEFGEVCRAALNADKMSNDSDPGDLRKELIQVAAVAVAWVEALDKITYNNMNHDESL